MISNEKKLTSSTSAPNDGTDEALFIDAKGEPPNLRLDLTFPGVSSKGLTAHVFKSTSHQRYPVVFTLDVVHNWYILAGIYH